MAQAARTLPRSIQFALAAAADALAAAQWSPATPAQRQRTGVAIGTGISGIQDLLEAHDTLAAKVRCRTNRPLPPLRFRY